MKLTCVTDMWTSITYKRLNKIKITMRKLYHKKKSVWFRVMYCGLVEGVSLIKNVEFQRMLFKNFLSLIIIF
jgi:hypothetical protein